MTAGVAHDFNNVLSVILTVCAGEITAATNDPSSERAPPRSPMPPSAAPS